MKFYLFHVGIKIADTYPLINPRIISDAAFFVDKNYRPAIIADNSRVLL